MDKERKRKEKKQKKLELEEVENLKDRLNKHLAEIKKLFGEDTGEMEEEEHNSNTKGEGNYRLID